MLIHILEYNLNEHIRFHGISPSDGLCEFLRSGTGLFGRVFGAHVASVENTTVIESDAS